MRTLDTVCCAIVPRTHVYYACTSWLASHKCHAYGACVPCVNAHACGCGCECMHEARVFMRTHQCVRPCASAHMRVHVRAHVRAYMHVCVYVCLRAHTRVCVRTQCVCGTACQVAPCFIAQFLDAAMDVVHQDAPPVCVSCATGEHARVSHQPRAVSRDITYVCAHVCACAHMWLCACTWQCSRGCTWMRVPQT